MAKESLRNHVKKRRSSGWNGNAKKTVSGVDNYEGTQYAGGRKKGTPNLKKLDNGDVLNQYGVEFTQAEKKALENAVNRANRKRMKMLEAEGNLPRYVGGQATGDTVKSLQLMGKESDFIISRRHKSLQKFKTREDYDKYMKQLEHVNSPTYVDDRIRAYKRNHMTALENAFGDDAKDVMMKIRMMKPKEYMELLQKDEDLEINYIYDPSEATAKLNRIRSALGMKLKEEEMFEE